ncbi:unnamed protein product [Prunus armeniaca]
MMMNDTTVVIVARNSFTPMDEILLTGRSNEEAIDDSMAFSIQSVVYVSNMVYHLRARANEIQDLNIENLSLQRMLHESQQEVEKLKEENKALLKLISNEKILGDHERLMAKLKRLRPLTSEASIT